MLRLTQFDDNESKFGGTIVSEWKRMNQNSEDSNIFHQSAPFWESRNEPSDLPCTTCHPGRLFQPKKFFPVRLYS